MISETQQFWNGRSSKETKDEVPVQAQGFARLAGLFAVRLGLVILGWCFLDVGVTLGFAFEAVASKLCFRDKSQLKWRFWWRECAQNVSKTFQSCAVVASFAEANMI